MAISSPNDFPDDILPLEKQVVRLLVKAQKDLWGSLLDHDNPVDNDLWTDADQVIDYLTLGESYTTWQGLSAL